MKCEFATTGKQKFMGLMLRKEVKRPLVLVLGRESRIGASIHMMFMRFPIDAVFLDKDKRVVDIARLEPWTFNYTPKKAAKYVVEMGAGAAKFKIGEQLELE